MQKYCAICRCVIQDMDSDGTLLHECNHPAHTQCAENLYVNNLKFLFLPFTVFCIDSIHSP
jgi:hypothetical protein